jgi:hypothetical protein
MLLKISTTKYPISPPRKMHPEYSCQNSLTLSGHRDVCEYSEAITDSITISLN